MTTDDKMIRSRRSKKMKPRISRFQAVVEAMRKSAKWDNLHEVATVANHIYQEAGGPDRYSDIRYHAQFYIEAARIVLNRTQAELQKTNGTADHPTRIVRETVTEFYEG